MLHVRPENRAEFERKVVRWVEAMAPSCKELPPSALHVTNARNPEGAKLYMAKGIDPFYARLWDIRPVDCGLVHGRRAGTARSLGPAVWKEFKRAYKQHLGKRP